MGELIENIRKMTLRKKIGGEIKERWKMQKLKNELREYF